MVNLAYRSFRYLWLVDRFYFCSLGGWEELNTKDKVIFLSMSVFFSFGMIPIILVKTNFFSELLHSSHKNSQNAK
jgi:hypothetical protein